MFIGFIPPFFKGGVGGIFGRYSFGLTHGPNSPLGIGGCPLPACKRTLHLPFIFLLLDQLPSLARIYLPL
ncbi:MAG: hypothetical protein OET42_04620, partial [Deltaproteobacteria bacterium]|nr:hypothetical protein [Deltaproteobacteria bacterium]